MFIYLALLEFLYLLVQIYKLLLKYLEMLIEKDYNESYSDCIDISIEVLEEAENSPYFL